MMEAIEFAFTALARPFHALPTSVIDFIVKVLNFFLFLFRPRKISTRRYANLHHEAFELASNLRSTQFYAIFLRISNKYKYHPLQRFEFVPRKFDLSGTLAERVSAGGTQEFYQAICPRDAPPITANFQPDLTELEQISTVQTSAGYLFDTLSKRHGAEIAGLARDLYARGFTRPIRVLDRADWKAFREEMTEGVHVAARMNMLHSDLENNTAIIALSYKGHISARNHDVSLNDKEGKKFHSDLQELVNMSPVHFEDFRWSQLMRTAIQIASEEKKEYVRIWIDRFVMLERDQKYKDYIYTEKQVKWEDFGLWAYAVCPVIRLYQQNEKYYGTNFWRKLEMVMAVAGKGLFVDDYMLWMFDDSIYYGESLYKRLRNGICKIGGKGKYVRGVTLAIATAILTDGVSVAGLNEDKKTKKGIIGWKAWALRTIAEGAYSSLHAAVIQEERAFRVGLSQFCTIAYWESISTQNNLLEGDSYLDMSLQKSTEFRTNERWNGICEWIGMVTESCEIEKRNDISRYLDDCAQIKLYTNITGHVAGLLTLRSKDYKYRRMLAVNLARFSTVQSGQVTAIAEATGLNMGESWLPWYFVHVCSPETDQTNVLTKDGVLWFKYRPIQVFFKWSIGFVWTIFVIYCLIWFPLAIAFRNLAGPFVAIGFVHMLVLGFLVARLLLPWPWSDHDLIGDGLFDNILMHGIYEAGIKRSYRAFKDELYSSIGWGDDFLGSGAVQPVDTEDDRAKIHDGIP